ncbi:MAG: S41 family peptidase [Blastocatellia bacterium]|jgi:carboxyl-terminal processing protease
MIGRRYWLLSAMAILTGVGGMVGLLGLFDVVPAMPDLLRSVKAQEETTRQRVSADYQKAVELIEANYFDQPGEEVLVKSAIQGMLKSLDPHSDYLDRKSYQEFNEKQHSQYFGIGSQIGTRHRSTYILEPFKDSPASRAGLRYGDQIVAIDGTDSSTWTSDKIREKLLGDRGTQVTVTVKRVGEANPLSMTITRDGIALPSIPNYYKVKPTIGYIGLTRNFQSTTSEEMSTAMAELIEKGATSFILDLRQNRGGYLDQAIKVCDQLLQRGQKIVSVRGRQGRNFDQNAVAESGATDNHPLVVLIDRDSASASEIVAGAIQDHDRGLIIGEPSFGKGLVQRIFPLFNGGALTLTIAHYYTPSGRLIQRDYSNGSLFEYYSKRNQNQSGATAPRTDERKTDLGRMVYGGGGIEPDIKVENADTFNSAQARLYAGLFLFTRELGSGRLPGLSQYQVKGLTYGYQIRGNEYIVTDEVLKAYREWVGRFYKENADYGVTPAMIEDNIVWTRKQLRQELLFAAYGSDRAQQGMADLDLQLQRAIAEMPNAADLTSRAWKRNGASNPGQ